MDFFEWKKAKLMSNMPIISRCMISGQVTIKEHEILVGQWTETWKWKTRREMDRGAPAGRRCASEAYIQPLLIHGENCKSHTNTIGTSLTLFNQN